MHVFKRLALSSFVLVSVGLFAVASFGSSDQEVVITGSVDDGVEVDDDQSPCGQGNSCQFQRCKNTDVCNRSKCGFGWSCQLPRCKDAAACKKK